MKPYAHLDKGFRNYLQKLIDTGSLKSKCGDAAAGISKILLSDGFESLSLNQFDTFFKQVIGKCIIDKCILCKDDIPWSQMYEAINNRGFCEVCLKTRQEVMKKKPSKK